MALKDKTRIVAHVTLKERDAINDRAKSLNLSRAEYLRRVAMGTPLPQFGARQAVLDLCKVSGDLARLGNLLKLALDNVEAEGLQLRSQRIIDILNELGDNQTILKQSIKEITI